MSKYIIRILLVLLATIVTSCSLIGPSDPADAFVGNYSFTSTYSVTWGGDSATLTDEGTFTLTKISKNQVRMTGSWETNGTITGNNTITFQNDLQMDEESGYITYKFGTGTLTGNILTFDCSGTGSVKYINGKSYPYNSNGTVIAVKH